MSDNEIDESQLSEDEIAVEETEHKAVKPKQTSPELFDEWSKILDSINELDVSFIEKDKSYEKEKKEYYSSRKKLQKELDILLTKFNKTFKHDMAKSCKTRKTGNSGKGGFNKPCAVPKKLRTFLGLEEDALLPRPTISRLLSEKFKELNFKFGKVIKITDKKSAKELGCPVDYEIQFNEVQTFIKQFYVEEKKELVV